MTLKLIAKILSVIFLLAAFAIALFVMGSFIRAQYTQKQDRIASSPKGGTHVQAYDTQLFVQRVGATNAPVVVFVHGTGAWSELWRPYMNQVAGMGYQAIALDIPPFGYSLPPTSERYSKAEQAKRIFSALDSLGIQKAIFVSHSIGSSPLMEAVLTHPERVNKLVLVSAALGLDAPLSNGEESLLQGLIKQRWLSETLSACIFANPLFTEMLVKSFVTEKDKVTSAWVELYRTPFSLSEYYQNVALWIPQLLEGRGAYVSDNPESYRGIQFPTFLIWGANDTITPMSQAEYLVKLIPDAKLMVLPGGHVPMIESPNEFSRFLTTALK